ncbi:hypothetical protein B0O80DRAFT_263843 [Mortierella sp. GBAus27b]|nr:hypothetical protein B0O80DRAFT_263843 [Mortierella sp. GBAus27b]
MIILPELDDEVFQQLGRHDLTQCIRVNKAWHVAVIPHLWGDLSHVPRTKLEAFGRMILGDYLHEQQPQFAQEGGNDTEGHAPRPPYSSSVLAKYGRWIRVLPNPNVLAWAFESFKHQVPALDSEHGLLLYLFNHCPSTQVQGTILYLNRSLDNLHSAITTFALPRARELRLFIESPPGSESLREALGRCSDALTSLHLNAAILLTEADIEVMHSELARNEAKVLTSLKELRLGCCIDGPNSTAFWLWLCKVFSQVKRLEVSSILDTGIQNLTQGISAYMSEFDELILGSKYEELRLTDDDIAALLGSPRKGLRIMATPGAREFGHRSMEALAKHFSTLELLRIGASQCPMSNCFLQALSSCPRLHTLNVINDGIHLFFDVNVFIDRDPTTGSLKEWQCEASLNVLQIKIGGIPRPDLKENDVQESYPGQGQDCQSQVYERLARMTNLETLWLGSDGSSDGGLEWSLDSGLWKLAGLKKLKELNVYGMSVKVGVKEVEWMTEQWPRLHSLFGICGLDGGGTEWLEAHRPDIKLV